MSARRKRQKDNLPLSGFSFIGRRNITMSISAALLLIGIISLLVQGLNLGVGFTGGSVLELQYDSPVDTAEIEEIVREYPGMETAEVVRMGEPDTPTMRVRSSVFPEGDERDQLYADLEEPGTYQIILLDRVSPEIGEELARAALLAVAIAIAGMVLYITVRFEFRFAMCAIAALTHDALIALGLFSLFQLEITTAFIAAILTIVGYSVNDTIVVFDRVRENLKYRQKGEEINETVDLSIRQVLMRTLATSVTTFAAVGSIYLFGGQTLRNFTLALLFGIVIGTYSSVFFASPLWVWWHERSPGDTISRV